MKPIASPPPCQTPASAVQRVLDDDLPYRLSAAANAVSQLISGAYRQRFGISVSQWRLIAVVSDAGPMTPQQLGLRTQMDKVTVSRAGQALVQRGLMRRLENDQDGRSHRLSLSQAGQALFAQVVPLALQLQAELLARLPPAEIDALKQQLAALQNIATQLRQGNFKP